MPNKLEEAGIAWIILGAQTKPTLQPKIEWVREIVEAADKAGVKVFLKDNLMPLIEPVGIDKDFLTKVAIDGDKAYVILRQELPSG